MAIYLQPICIENCHYQDYVVPTFVARWLRPQRRQRS